MTERGVEFSQNLSIYFFEVQARFADELGKRMRAEEGCQNPNTLKVVVISRKESLSFHINGERSDRWLLGFYQPHFLVRAIRWEAREANISPYEIGGVEPEPGDFLVIRQEPSPDKHHYEIIPGHKSQEQTPIPYLVAVK